MQGYNLALEAFLYGSAIYFFFRKKELVIIYIPVLFFTRNLIDEPFMRAIIWYALVVGLLGYSAHRINPFRRPNYAAHLLLIYFTLLFILSHDMSDTRSSYLSMICLIGVFIIAPNLYFRYDKEIIFRELYTMSCIVIVLFVGNCVFSSLTGYAPRTLYGHTTGVLYGNMGPTSFMLVPVALFIFLWYNFKQISLINVVLGFSAFAFLTLSMRRTSAFAGMVAVAAFLIMLFLEKDKKKFVQLLTLVVAVSGAGLLFTDIKDQFNERFDDRFERQDGQVVRGDEGRFTDHQMVWDDIFVHERYSAMFGFGFFNSSGNYAGGIRGTRSLHPDIPVIVHSSGLLGLGLYFAMVATGFFQAGVRCKSGHDKILLLFCLLIFANFTFSGRLTETSYTMGLFLLLFLPVAGAGVQRTESPVASSPEMVPASR